MEKLTKKMLSQYSKQGNKLDKFVANYIKNHSSGYDSPLGYINDVLRYGCVSGMVGGLIYYSDTLKFYKRFKEQINELLQDAIFNYGSIENCFGKKFDSEDPLALDTQNQNLLAWFGFEETCMRILNHFEIEY